MLVQLYIQNIAVIEKASIEFEPGFNVFTGETGAGKSILIDAISAVLGFRTSRDLIRTGADKAVVTALFDHVQPETIQLLAEAGYEPEEDGSLLLAREVSAEGKNSCKIGGRPATVSILRSIAGTLINIHGQHDNQALTSADQHIRFIDGFAGCEELLAEYRKQYQALVAVRHELEGLHIDEAEKAHRTELLTYQTQEIADANLVQGEEDELAAQRKLIHNSAKIVENIAIADKALSGTEDTEGLVAMLSTAKDALALSGRYLQGLEQMAVRVDEIYYELREYASDIRTYTAELEFDPADIDRIESRLDTIYKLKHKYGDSVEEVLRYLEKASGELSAISHSEERKKKLTAQLQQAQNAAAKLAQGLSQKRQGAAQRFTQAVGDELKFLDMPFVRLEIKREETALSPDGIDDMELMISTNPGEPPKPLSKIASGGELSRIMLSLKNVLADKDHVDTLIFDEIDTGVSGRAAQKIGQKLAQASHGRQIICVTHLAQVAAYANNHLLIEKTVRNNRTYTQVKRLSRAERVDEIARIIGGVDITDTVLKNADEMLTLATFVS